ncbi:hypothetical protein EON81_17980 [bacterium]|nr:MAG: hypothetical protein EON81_17980 [bacterium]
MCRPAGLAALGILLGCTSARTAKPLNPASEVPKDSFAFLNEFDPEMGTPALKMNGVSSTEVKANEYMLGRLWIFRGPAEEIRKRLGKELTPERGWTGDLGMYENEEELKSATFTTDPAVFLDKKPPAGATCYVATMEPRKPLLPPPLVPADDPNGKGLRARIAGPARLLAGKKATFKVTLHNGGAHPILLSKHPETIAIGQLRPSRNIFVGDPEKVVPKKIDDWIVVPPGNDRTLSVEMEVNESARKPITLVGTLATPRLDSLSPELRREVEKKMSASGARLIPIYVLSENRLRLDIVKPER